MVREEYFNGGIIFTPSETHDEAVRRARAERARRKSEATQPLTLPQDSDARYLLITMHTSAQREREKKKTREKKK